MAPRPGLQRAKVAASDLDQRECCVMRVVEGSSVCVCCARVSSTTFALVCMQAVVVFMQQCLRLCCVVVIARADSPVAMRIQRFRCRMGMDHRDCSQRIRRVTFQLNLFRWLHVSAASNPTRLPTHARARCTCQNRAFTRPVSCSAHLTWPQCMGWGFRFARLSSRLKLSVCIALKERAAARS